MRHLHSSSRFDRSVASITAAAASYSKVADLVTFTELDNPKREAGAKSGLGVNFDWYGPGHEKGCFSDTGIGWRKDKFSLVYSERHKVSNFTYINGKNHPTHPTVATYVVLRELKTGHVYVVTVAHTPPSVEGVLRSEPGRARSKAWFSVVRGQKNYANKLTTKYKAHGTLVIADWNVNFKKLWVRALFKSIMPRYNHTWKNLKFSGGTHAGGRVIDATLLKGNSKVNVSARLFRDDASSDHRPYIEDLT